MQGLVPELFLFIFVIVLFLLELGVPGFILFFFGIAWAVAFVLPGINLSLDAQLVLFVCTSLFALFILRGKPKGISRGKEVNIAESGGESDEFTGNGAIFRDPNIAWGIRPNGTQWYALEGRAR